MATHKERMRMRSKITQRVREFFSDQDFMEVDTPVAIHAPAPEVHIEAISLKVQTDKYERRFLQTSPELAMKRLLSQGFEKIFQIAPVFRDGEISHLHTPEFRLLEWYRRNDSWESLMGDCENLLRGVAKTLFGQEELNFHGNNIDLAKPFARISLNEAFEKHAHFPILENLTTEALIEQCEELEIFYLPDDSWDDLYHRIFLNRVEPELLKNPEPFFLTHYPAPLASLATLCADDPRCAERFELYVGGIELANGFGELTDPEEQRLRFEQDKLWRAEEGLQDYPLDERFLAALADLPPSAGIALGLDRLYMLLCDVQHIDDVAFIPWSQA
ncbi:MAG: EF-P lysine aminoacylase GenX [Myxococcales bacterium]|nr:EF-P lysine aminoacylase GenX [Myxococcales bacterium]